MAKTRGQYHVTAYDPGSAATGWAAFSVSKLAFTASERDTSVLAHIKWWATGEFRGTERVMVEQAVELARRAKYGPMPFMSQCDAVSEDFDLVQTLGGKELLSPVRINAMLDWELNNIRVPFHLQSRSLRTSITSVRLRRWGFKPAGKDSKAALQHGLTWLRRIKKESIKKPWILTEEEVHALKRG